MRDSYKSIIMSLAAVVVLGAPAAAQARVKPTHTAPLVLPADSISVVATFQKLTAAMHRGDSATFVSLFAPDAVVMTPMGELVSIDEYRRTSLPGLMTLASALKVDRDSLTRVSVSRGTAWVGSSSAASGRVDGYLAHVYMERLAIMKKTAEGWKITVLHASSR